MTAVADKTRRITVEQCDEAIRRHWGILQAGAGDEQIARDWIDVWLDQRLALMQDLAEQDAEDGA